VSVYISGWSLGAKQRGEKKKKKKKNVHLIFFFKLPGDRRDHIPDQDPLEPVLEKVKRRQEFHLQTDALTTRSCVHIKDACTCDNNYTSAENYSCRASLSTLNSLPLLSPLGQPHFPTPPGKDLDHLPHLHRSFRYPCGFGCFKGSFPPTTPPHKSPGPVLRPPASAVIPYIFNSSLHLGTFEDTHHNHITKKFPNTPPCTPATLLNVVPSTTPRNILPNFLSWRHREILRRRYREPSAIAEASNQLQHYPGSSLRVQE
jgi:hypothetical protein